MIFDSTKGSVLIKKSRWTRIAFVLLIDDIMVYLSFVTHGIYKGVYIFTAGEQFKKTQTQLQLFKNVEKYYSTYLKGLQMLESH